MSRCRLCGTGDARPDCPACGGLGYTEPDSEQDLPAEVMECVGPFLEAWSLMEARGVGGWLLLTGRRRGRLAHEFVAALQVFDGELRSLELEADVEQARKDRAASGSVRRDK